MAIRSEQCVRKFLAVMVCAAYAGVAPVQAQTVAPSASDDAIAEVIVTAQRTAAPASKTPVSMTVLSGDQLAAAVLDSPSALGARLPNVHLDGAPDGLRITMRGVSNADTTEKGDPSAAFMLDGIYIARPQAQDLSFFDVARVEVLRGPQGTLYGRNSTAGAINVISNAPGKTLEGAASVELGNYATRRATAMLNVPVSDTLALRAALAYNKHDSYLINKQGTAFDLGGDRDDVSARLSAKLALGTSGQLLVRYERSSVRQNNDSIVPASNFYTFDAAAKPTWKEASTEQRLTNSFVPFNAPLQQGGGRAVSDGLSAELEWDLGDAEAVHAVVRNRLGQAVATGRLLRRVDGCAAIGGLAVIPALRGGGIGRAVLDALLQVARGQGAVEVRLDSAVDTVAFYAGAGFGPSGPPTEVAGIAHQPMSRRL